MSNNNNTDAKTAAKHYRDALGFNVIPLKGASKTPALPKGHPYLYRRATDEELESFDFKNLGIVTGKTSGIVVLDVDDEGPNTLKEKGWTIPPTVTVKTMNGRHYYFRYPSDAERLPTRLRFAKDLDFKADGGYVVAPPSVVVKSGKDRKGIDYLESYEYEWISRPEDLGVAECPEWLLEAIRERLERFSNVVLTAPIEDGERNTELTRRAGKLTRVLDSQTTREVLHFINERYCRNPLLPDEVDGITLYENDEVSPSLIGNDDDDNLPMVRLFRDMTPPTGPRPYIVDGVIFKGHAAALYGDGGSAKSLLVMHMGQRIARGAKWLGFDTVKTNVLYLDFELDGEEQSRRAYQVAVGDGYTEPPEGFFYLAAAAYPTRALFEQALRECVGRDIGVVIVDSLGFALEGDAEASRDVLRFFREVGGSFRRSNSTRSVFQVEPSNNGDDFIDLTVRHKKVNFGPKLEPFGISVSFEAEKVSIVERELEAAELAEEGTLNAKDRVLMALAEGSVFPVDIAEATRLELGTVKNALTALRKLGKVEPTGTKDHRGSNEVRLVSSSSLPISDDDSDACEQSQGSREDNDKRSVCACGGSACIECLTQELPRGNA